MVQVTTIRLSSETKTLLDGLKTNPRETYDDVMKRLAKMAYDDEPLSDEEIEDIKASMDDIKAGRVQTLKEVRNELGI
jgi:predicted transcriptional regulator